MGILEVGKPYHPSIRRWPEAAQLRITPNGTELALFFSRPTDKETRDLRRGAAQFAWIEAGDADATHAALLAYRFGDDPVPWADAVYHPGRDPEAGLPAEAGSDAQHLLVVVVLVDADTGIVKAMRQISWPPEFVTRVAATVTRMLATPYSEATHNAAVGALYRRYPSTEALIQAPGVITCEGGADRVHVAPGPNGAPR